MNPDIVLANTESTTNETGAVPRDSALPGLALLRQPAELRETLTRLLECWLGPEGQLMDVRFAVRRFAPGKRCIFALDLTASHQAGGHAERRRLLGKIYNQKQGARAFEILRELQSLGFAAGRFAVPQPLAYDPGWQLLLQSWAEGKLLRSLLLACADMSQEIDGAAQWLLKLHTCGARCGRRYTFSRHLHMLALWNQRLAEIDPDGERPRIDLLARIAARAQAHADWKPGPTHRDFSPDHLAIDGTQLTGLDFDEFCQYDPLFDVAHFVAHLQYLGLIHFGALNQFGRLAERFLAAYQAGAPEYCAARVQLYLAIAYFKLAHIVGAVVQPRGWKPMVDTLLREAQRFV